MNDILPMYQEYCSVKREYQLGNIDKIKVINSMKNVCKEIDEFIKSLYSHTDMQEERNLLDKMITDLKSAN